MDQIAGALERLENNVGIRTIHSELRLVSLLFAHRQLESMTLHRLSGSSLSSHNRDIRRLLDLGLIEAQHSEDDRRKKLYCLTDFARSAISRALEPSEAS